MPLAFEAGEEAQVDWGEARVIENGTQCARCNYSACG